MHKGIIYKATNKSNGKVYIGQTSRTLEERIKNHLHQKPHTAFAEVLRTAGADAFIWEIVEHIVAESADALKSHLHIAENYHIMKNCSSDPEYGYNIIGTKGGRGVFASEGAQPTIRRVPESGCPGFAVRASQARPFAVYNTDGDFLKYFSSSADGRSTFAHKGCHIATPQEVRENIIHLNRGDREIVVKLLVGEMPPKRISIERPK